MSTTITTTNTTEDGSDETWFGLSFGIRRNTKAPEARRPTNGKLSETSGNLMGNSSLEPEERPAVAYVTINSIIDSEPEVRVLVSQRPPAGYESDMATIRSGIQTTPFTYLNRVLFSQIWLARPSNHTFIPVYHDNILSKMITGGHMIDTGSCRTPQAEEHMASFQMKEEKNFSLLVKAPGKNLLPYDYGVLEYGLRAPSHDDLVTLGLPPKKLSKKYPLITAKYVSSYENDPEKKFWSSDYNPARASENFDVVMAIPEASHHADQDVNVLQVSIKRQDRMTGDDAYLIAMLGDLKTGAVLHCLKVSERPININIDPMEETRYSTRVFHNGINIFIFHRGKHLVTLPSCFKQTVDGIPFKLDFPVTAESSDAAQCIFGKLFAFGAQVLIAASVSPRSPAQTELNGSVQRSRAGKTIITAIGRDRAFVSKPGIGNANKTLTPYAIQCGGIVFGEYSSNYNPWSVGVGDVYLIQPNKPAITPPLDSIAEGRLRLFSVIDTADVPLGGIIVKYDDPNDPSRFSVTTLSGGPIQSDIEVGICAGLRQGACFVEETSATYIKCLNYVRPHSDYKALGRKLFYTKTNFHSITRRVPDFANGNFYFPAKELVMSYNGRLGVDFKMGGTPITISKDFLLYQRRRFGKYQDVTSQINSMANQTNTVTESLFISESQRKLISFSMFSSPETRTMTNLVYTPIRGILTTIGFKYLKAVNKGGNFFNECVDTSLMRSILEHLRLLPHQPHLIRHDCPGPRPSSGKDSILYDSMRWPLDLTLTAKFLLDRLRSPESFAKGKSGELLVQSMKPLRQAESKDQTAPIPCNFSCGVILGPPDSFSLMGMLLKSTVSDEYYYCLIPDQGGSRPSRIIPTSFNKPTYEVEKPEQPQPEQSRSV